MTDLQVTYTKPQPPPQVILSDEHISKLEITAETILLVRVPISLATQQGRLIMDSIQQVVQRKTGHDPGILLVARDCDLASLNFEALEMLRAEIDATLQYKLGEKGN